MAYYCKILEVLWLLLLLAKQLISQSQRLRLCLLLYRLKVKQVFWFFSQGTSKNLSTITFKTATLITKMLSILYMYQHKKITIIYAHQAFYLLTIFCRKYSFIAYSLLRKCHYIIYILWSGYSGLFSFFIEP